jgi:hypothetical protein
LDRACLPDGIDTAEDGTTSRATAFGTGKAGVSELEVTAGLEGDEPEDDVPTTGVFAEASWQLPLGEVCIAVGTVGVATVLLFEASGFVSA